MVRKTIESETWGMERSPKMRQSGRGYGLLVMLNGGIGCVRYRRVSSFSLGLGTAGDAGEGELLRCRVEHRLLRGTLESGIVRTKLLMLDGCSLHTSIIR